MKYKRIKLLGFMLTLALVIGLLPVMSLTAFAAKELSESFETNKQQESYSGEHFKITCDDIGDKDGFKLTSSLSHYFGKVFILQVMTFLRIWFAI